MIKPVNFAFNAETAVNNSFQVKSAEQAIHEKALKEFDAFVDILREHHIDVTVIEDTPLPHTPDSVFPNNWISFHEDGSLLLYPMFAKNRREERKLHVFFAIEKKFEVGKTIDLSWYESTHQFLEGTGSMVLDRENKIAYACLSPRTDKTVLQNFCDEMSFRAVSFTAVDAEDNPIYHTNVMMCVADDYVVICLESIKDADEKETVVNEIMKSGKQIIPISYHQMNHFAGNMLQVHNLEGEKLLVMSAQAYHSLTDEQVKQLTAFNRIIHSDITTIETNGGGSARCMMAEVFLPLK
jgi:hypothetical protein